MTRMQVSVQRDTGRKRGLWLRFISLLIAFSSLLWWQGGTLCEAQSDAILWSEPLNLSNTPSLSTHPAIVTDDYGYVHVFWSEEIGGRARESGDLGGEGNSVLYTRWDGVNWTPPVDILFVHGEVIAEYVAVARGPDNMLHAVWTGQTDFYYSYAVSWQADSAHAWSEPLRVATDSVRGGIESSIATDATGNVHIIYATRGDGAGVYHIRSQDGGGSWGGARRLSLPLSSLEESFTHARVTVDGADRLHVVWQTNREGGTGQALYHARSIDAGVTWSAPLRLGYRDVSDTFLGWAHLTASKDSELHLVYIDGTNKGRLYRTSSDGGETWSEPRFILSKMEGVNGYVMPVIDGLGQMHLIVNMRLRVDQIVGIYYARWLGREWSRVTPLDTSSPAAPSAHYAAAVVRLGNEIHVVYNQINIGEIWHLRGTLLGVEPKDSADFPDPELEPITYTLDVPAATPEVVTQSVQSSLDPFPPSPAHMSPVGILLISVGFSALLVLSAVVWSRLRSGS